MAKNTAKRERFFSLGAGTLERLNPELKGLYACPICRTCYPRSALDDKILTLEHAPPKALGGKGIALTCKPCNSRAGHTIDAHARRLQDVRGFASRKMDRPLHVKVSVEGVDKPVNIKAQGSGGYFFTGLPNHNPPDVQKQLERALERTHEEETWDGFQLRFTLPPVSIRKAMLSHLRSAYIAAFATFGYHFALSPALGPVRSQLMDVEQELLKDFRMIAKGEPDNYLAIVDAPVKCLCVQMDRDVILFPPEPRNVTFYETLRERVGSDMKVEGTRLPWPTEMRFILDSG